MDDHGFLLTGMDIPAGEFENSGQTPLFSKRVVWACSVWGDARSRSTKRMAPAIGEGSTGVRMVFDRLGATGLTSADPMHRSD